MQDVTPDARLSQIVLKLIERAESRDEVDDLIEQARLQNPQNQKLAQLDLAGVQFTPSTVEIVDAAGGAASFKQSLKEALAQLDEIGMQLVAARDLSALLADASDEEAATLYLALLGNVKTNRPDEVVAELAPVVAASLRRQIGGGKRPAEIELDLARTRLCRIDLSGLDLHEADVAFADLRYANLENANMWRTRGYGTNVTKAGLSRSNLEEARWHSCIARETRFHDCRMISVVLKEADLTAAEFQQSLLQGAHFEGADLSGTRFEQANLSDAYFTGATIDEVAATSISRATNWDKARFDPATLALISEKAGN